MDEVELDASMTISQVSALEAAPSLAWTIITYLGRVALAVDLVLGSALAIGAPVAVELEQPVLAVA